MNPVKGGNPAPLIKERRKFLELVCIKMMIGPKTKKYINTNHHSVRPDKLKIQPIWTMPEKITINKGEEIVSIVAAAAHTLTALRVHFERNTIATRETGAIFCQV